MLGPTLTRGAVLTVVRVSLFWCHHNDHAVERSTGGGQNGSLLEMAIELEGVGVELEPG